MPATLDLPRAERRRALKSAQICMYGADGVIDCTIRNISNTGAKLSVATPVGVPELFELRQPSQLSRHCRIVWRKTHEIGVQFIMEPLRI